MHLLLVAFKMVIHKSLYSRVDYNVLDRSGAGFEVTPGRSVEPFGIEQPKTVFIADDSELVRAIIRQALEWSTDLRLAVNKQSCCDCEKNVFQFHVKPPRS